MCVAALLMLAVVSRNCCCWSFVLSGRPLRCSRSDGHQPRATASKRRVDIASAERNIAVWQRFRALHATRKPLLACSKPLVCLMMLLPNTWSSCHPVILSCQLSVGKSFCQQRYWYNITVVYTAVFSSSATLLCAVCGALGC